MHTLYLQFQRLTSCRYHFLHDRKIEIKHQVRLNSFHSNIEKYLSNLTCKLVSLMFFFYLTHTQLLQTKFFLYEK